VKVGMQEVKSCDWQEAIQDGDKIAGWEELEHRH
jgi:hypothetical protein